MATGTQQSTAYYNEFQKTERSSLLLILLSYDL